MEGKTVVLGVTGSIAAYKAAEIARALIKQKATVKVVMTKNATRFITPLTLATLTGHPVIASLFEKDSNGKIAHLSLNKEAHLILVAPATASILAKVATGIADDVLSTTILCASSTIVFAPAMHSQMYLNPATQKNLFLLKKRGYIIIEPEEGELASKEEGIGRLASIEKIVATVNKNLRMIDDLKAKVILVTAGGTQEPLDPIRFLGNRSSGKMGYALAEEARKRGAEVILVSAPTYLQPPFGVTFVPVKTARQMGQAVLKHFNQADVVIKAAAVSDFKPVTYSQEKIKRGRSLKIELEENPDILEELGQKTRNEGQKKILVGFVAESKDLIQRAKQKMERKNLDLVVANDIKKSDSGFGKESLEFILLGRGGKVEEFPLVSKVQAAQIILQRVANLLSGRGQFDEEHPN